MEHPSAAGIDDRTAKDRFSSEEARALDRSQNDIYMEARQAAEAHRQTRKHIMNWVSKINIFYQNLMTLKFATLRSNAKFFFYKFFVKFQKP